MFLKYQEIHQVNNVIPTHMSKNTLRYPQRWCRLPSRLVDDANLKAILQIDITQTLLKHFAQVMKKNMGLSFRISEKLKETARHL